MVGVVDQGVGERHSHGAGPHHEVADIDRAGHQTTQAPRRRCVYGSVGCWAGYRRKPIGTVQTKSRADVLVLQLLAGVSLTADHHFPLAEH